jgi:hypothetical protein
VARFSASVQTGPDAYPASCTMGTGSFRGMQRPGRGVDHPPPSCTKVKERVELYLHSSSGPSWPVIGWTLHYLGQRGTEGHNLNNKSFFLLRNECLKIGYVLFLGIFLYMHSSNYTIYLDSQRRILICLSTCLISETNWRISINPLNTKRRLIYLNTQFVPRSKHFSSRL